MVGNPDTPIVGSRDPTHRSRLRRWLVGAFIAAVGLTIAALFLWPRPEVDLRSLLAQQLGIQDDTLLFVNLPPTGYRMPGAILLRDGNVPWGRIHVQDADFSRGRKTAQTARVERVSVARGSLGGSAGQEDFIRNALDLLADRRGKVEVELSFDGNSVELPDLPDRIAGSSAIRSVSENGVGAFVIYRAWEGTLKLSIKQARGVSVQLLDSLVDSLSVIAADADADVRFEGETLTNTRRDLLLAEADVFAFEAYDAASLYRRAAPQPVTARSQEVDADSAVATVLRLDPESIEPEELTETLRYIGPEAAEAAIRVMRRGDVEVLERGATVLERVPPEHRPRVPADVPTALASPDPVVRAYAVLQVPEADETRSVRQLSTAIRDADAVVRFLAIEKLADVRSPEVAPVLRGATRDSDPAVALSANTALFEATAPEGRELASASTALRTGSVERQSAALRWIRRERVPADSALPLLVRGLSSRDAAVRNESLRGLAALGADATPAVESIKLLLRDPNPQTRTLAQEALRKITAPAGPA